MASQRSSYLFGEQLDSIALSERHPFLQPNLSHKTNTSETDSYGVDSDGHIPKEQGPQFWRPFWVRRRVFLLFAAWFAILAAAVEIVLAVFVKLNGIAEPKEGMFYVWTFGPTAVFVITAAFWARVEYQSYRSMPWIELSNGPSPARTTIQLDYSRLASKVLIALSSGLLYLQLGDVVTYDTPLPLRDSLLSRVPRFDNSSVVYDNSSVDAELHDYSMVDTEAYDTFLGISYLNRTLPFGYSPKVAYQTFTSPQSGWKDSSTAVVQGIWSDLTCEESKVSIPSNQSLSFGGYRMLSMSLRSSLCQNTVNAEISVINATKSSNENFFFIIDGYFGPGGGSRCKGADGPVFALGYARFVGPVKSSTDLHQSMIIFCRPKYYLGNVKVTTSKASSPVVERVSSPQPTLLEGDMGWLVRRLYQNHARGYIDSMNYPAYNPNGYWPSNYYSRPPSDMPSEISEGFRLLGKPRPADWRNLTFQSTTDAIKEFYQTFDSIVAHFHLRQIGDNKGTVKGTLSERRNRLLVKHFISHIISGVLGLFAVALAVATSLWVPSKSFLFNKPGTLSGAIRNLGNSSHFLNALSKLDETTIKLLGSYKTERRAIGDNQSKMKSEAQLFMLSSYGLATGDHNVSEADKTGCAVYNPIVLRRVCQSAILLVLLGALFSLQILFWIPKFSKGIGNVGSNAYIHYTWTTVPTLIAVGISTYFASFDREVRRIMPFASLKMETPFWIIDKDFTDMTAAEALYISGRRKQWPTLVTTSTLILVSFLTIFSATLFSVVQVPAHHAVQVQLDEWFASFGRPNRVDKSSVVLSNSGNFTYPAWTYHNLVLPKLSMAQPPKVISDNMTITTIVKALRPGTNCTRHAMSTIQPKYDGNYTASLQIELIPHKDSVGSWKSSCGVFWRPYCERIPSSLDPLWPCYDEVAPRYFFDAGVNVTDCSTSQFIWGSLNSTKKSWDFLAAYSCVDYVDEIDVELTLLWPSLVIDTTRPPRPIEQSAQRATRFYPPGDMIHLSTHLESSSSSRFVHLPGARHKLPIETIGDPEKESTVLAAQLEHWELLMTQLLSITIRRLYNETAHLEVMNYTFTFNNGTTVPLTNYSKLMEQYNKPWSGRPFNGPFNPPQADPYITATATDYTVYRLVQNQSSTYFLTALLVAVVLLHVTAVLIVPRKVIPSNFGTIVGVSSLLTNSNVFNYIKNSDFDTALKNKKFKLELVKGNNKKATLTLQVVE
ncbi:hypothetical protein B0O99DRAFT_689526 [Bisporella sp. PMI_857]|nr:hypothetical protein B0O99DRAFT_689526 [Bisporella sp. PMI_857]